ncbi:MAG TPA: class I SAM-dependent methyltransferase [Thermohalobaculum sp.]|nr:class I SAM-dependent methyltransferase [Thermohalobaculum sp.]
MDPVRRQYEAYPYPERDPADEARRLVEGSPSHPVEIDHFLFAGRRDWSRPFRALVAGGGTGDGLIMLAQKLADIRAPAEITYIDLAQASRAVAEARAAARNLSSIRFVTGDLLEAPALGPFDYIDCCGVLHHLPDPDAGFRALAQALAPGGGIGLMVYAPYGRTGVYPMQGALARLLGGDPPGEKVRLARTVLEALPQTNWFRKNDLVGDHRASDAGLHDLLLHARDRPYTVGALAAALERAGLGLVSFVEPARYDPLRYLPQSPGIAERVNALAPLDRAALAEELAGNLKTHVLYAARPGEAAEARPTTPEAVPHLRAVAPAALSRHVAGKGAVPVTTDGLRHVMDMPRSAAPLIALIDGRRPLGEIAAAARLDWLAFAAAWAPVHRALTGFNFLHYSRRARR